MDQVNHQLPTFEDKAEALHYYTLWRAWFGLCGFCKLPWNDVVDPANALSEDPAKVLHQVQNYVDLFISVIGQSVLQMSCKKGQNEFTIFNACLHQAWLRAART